MKLLIITKTVPLNKEISQAVILYYISDLFEKNCISKAARQTVRTAMPGKRENIVKKYYDN